MFAVDAWKFLDGLLKVYVMVEMGEKVFRKRGRNADGGAEASLNILNETGINGPEARMFG